MSVARELLLAEICVDPYTHMLVKMHAEAWALGYEQALRDHGLTEERLRESHADRCRKAYDQLASREEEAKAMIALAQVGSLIGGPRLGR